MKSGPFLIPKSPEFSFFLLRVDKVWVALLIHINTQGKLTCKTLVRLRIKNQIDNIKVSTVPGTKISPSLSLSSLNDYMLLTLTLFLGIVFQNNPTSFKH